MTDFEAILSQLEEPSRSRDPGSLLRAASFAEAFDKATTSVRRDRMGRTRAAFVTAAYGGVSSDRRNDVDAASPLVKVTPPRLPDKEAILRELRLAATSIDSLRALRRKLAWRCHPDRHDNANARRAENIMAEFNARIDAAIENIARGER